jgi:hypothetical protein
MKIKALLNQKPSEPYALSSLCILQQLLRKFISTDFSTVDHNFLQDSTIPKYGEFLGLNKVFPLLLTPAP